MIPGSYSCRFKAVEKQHLEQLKEQYAEERSEILQRSRKLSAETSRRRKALAIKRKTEAQREEKRRQEILHKRREQIRAATEKYQRGNTHYSPQNYEDEGSTAGYTAPGHAAPSLEEALAVVRDTDPRNRGQTHHTGYTSPQTRYTQGRITSAGSVRSVPSNHAKQAESSQSASSRHHYRYTMPVSAQTSRSSGQTQRQQLQSHSLRNMNSSRSLFEQQLQQHQQLLVQEQQQSLQHFNQAIRKEIDQDPKLQGMEEVVTPGEEDRSDSPVSVDSLEEGYPPAENRQVVTKEMLDTIRTESIETLNARPVNSTHTATITKGQPVSSLGSRVVSSGSSGSSGRTILQNSRSSQSPIAVVQPQVHHPPSSPELPPDKDPHLPEKTGQVKLTQKPSAVDMVMTNNNGRSNTQYYQDSVLNFVSGSDTYPGIQMIVGEQSAHSEKTTLPIEGFDAASKTWATPTSGPIKQPIITSTQYMKIASATPAATAPPGTESPVRPAPGHTHGTFTVVHSVAPAPKPQNDPKPAPVPMPVSNTVEDVEDVTQPSSRTSSAMEALKQYTQYPVFRVVGQQHQQQQQDSEDKHSILSDASTLVSGSDVAEESQPELPPKQVKGILKKFSSYGGPVPGTRSATNLHLGGVGGKRIVARSKSANPMLRDSLEVTKHRREDLPSHKKKSVRFADLDYSDDSDDHDDSANLPGSHVNSQKPPRPVSARPAAGSNSTSPSKIPRVASAGTVRRGTFLRPHPPTHPPTGRATRNSQRSDRTSSTTSSAQQVSGQADSKVSGQADSKVSSQPEGKPEAEPKKYAVYDANGVRLDRTPTDDEINFLWEKVRTCLSRQSMSSTTSSVQPESAGAAASKSQTMSQKYIDGNALAPQYRVATRLNNTYTNNYMGTQAVNSAHKKKVSMDTLSNYTKKASLLNQRTKQTPISTGAAPSQSVTTTTQSLHNLVSQQAPVTMVPSTAEPADVYPPDSQTHTYTQEGQTNVTESMAAFLAAEQLAAQSASESEIEAAMDKARLQHQVTNGGLSQQQSVPTALSIEEQRLVQSLERLNERLKLNESNMYPSTNYVPNPTPPSISKPQNSRENKQSQYGGFKGRQPITAAVKRHVTSNGTVPRHYYRGGSAAVTTPSSGSYTTPYRYR